MRAHPQVVGEQLVGCGRLHPAERQHLDHTAVPGDGLLQPEAGHAPVPGNATPSGHPLLPRLQLLQSPVHPRVPVRHQPGGEFRRLQDAETREQVPGCLQSQTGEASVPQQYVPQRHI